ncbi:acyl carrier protein [Paenibacillus aurantiacus]|uniref:Acyl carrier protein n=1 Tax=Paenibacillus aurantiacus TaxID=1936118 RepID=A0ABV5KYC8_9BACL
MPSFQKRPRIPQELIMDNIAKKKITCNINKILQELLGLDNIPSEQNLQECGLTSLYTIILIARIEERFEINFEDSELIFDNFSTFEKIILTVQNNSCIRLHQMTDRRE